MMKFKLFFLSIFILSITSTLSPNEKQNSLLRNDWTITDGKATAILYSANAQDYSVCRMRGPELDNTMPVGISVDGQLLKNVVMSVNHHYEERIMNLNAGSCVNVRGTKISLIPIMRNIKPIAGKFILRHSYQFSQEWHIISTIKPSTEIKQSALLYSGQESKKVRICHLIPPEPKGKKTPVIIYVDGYPLQHFLPALGTKYVLVPIEIVQNSCIDVFGKSISVMLSGEFDQDNLHEAYGSISFQ